MDAFGKRLKQDAACIDASISPELEERLKASVYSTGREVPERRPRSTTGGLWWASSLTGVAATLAIVAVVNLSGPEPEVGITEPPQQAFSVPQFDWKTKPAMLTQTLEQELVDLQSDLKKAEQTVRDDIDEIM